jgi:hypothetical protein
VKHARSPAPSAPIRKASSPASIHWKAVRVGAHSGFDRCGGLSVVKQPLDINFEAQHTRVLETSHRRVSKEAEEQIPARLRPAADLGRPPCAWVTNCGTSRENGSMTGLLGLLSPRGWRLLAAPGVSWRSLAALVRLLISRFSVRFRVGAFALRSRRRLLCHHKSHYALDRRRILTLAWQPMPLFVRRQLGLTLDCIPL